MQKQKFSNSPPDYLTKELILNSVEGSISETTNNQLQVSQSWIEKEGEMLLKTFLIK